MSAEDYIPIEENSFRLTDIIELAKSYFFYALKYWWVPIITGLLIAGFYFYRSYKTPPAFTAKVSFVLVDNPNSGGGGFANILSQFGLQSGKRGANMNRIMDLLNSREIIGRALFSKTTFLEKEDFLANHYITIFELHDSWKEGINEDLYDFYFEHDSLDGFNYLENSVLKGLQNRVSKWHMSYEVTDGDMFIIRIVSASEYMSYELANSLFHVLDSYYVEKTVEKHQETFDIVNKRTDSLRNVLASAEARLARFQDKNRSIFKKESLLEEDRLGREVNLANSLYLESARNLESARMSLLSSKPIIQPVDMPMYPLKAKFQKPRDHAIRGAFIGGVLGVFLLFGLKFVFDLLEKEKQEEQKENGQSV
ncbi:MAG: hypothetical protein AAF502_14840 [Bacteroidota bacterium]